MNSCICYDEFLSNIINELDVGNSLLHVHLESEVKAQSRSCRCRSHNIPVYIRRPLTERHNDIIQCPQKGYRACSSGSPRSDIILYVSIEFITEISKAQWDDAVTFCNNIKTTNTVS